MQINYYNFWPGFDPKSMTFFETLFSEIPEIKKPIGVVSVFPNQVPNSIGDRSQFWVSYSGECYSQPVSDNFDLHLIMDKEDPKQKIVSLPLFSVYAYLKDVWEKLYLPRKWSEKNKFCSMVVSNPSGSLRNYYFGKLSQYQRVDSWGRWLNNTGGLLPPGQEGTEDILGSYKFSLCFENNIRPYYLTEKLLHAYLAGAIPIYAGASASREWLNPKAFLFLEDSTEEAEEKLLAQVRYLNENPDAYREMWEQPLLKAPEIPKEMSLEYFREKIRETLSV